MLTIPNLRHLRAFEAVARYGSVGQASMRIHISQPAVTQAIAKLELQIGSPLFDRRSTGSYLTGAGEILLRRVERFFAMVRESLKAVDQRSLPDENGKRCVLNMVTSTQIRSLIATADPATATETAIAMGVSETTFYRSARKLEQIMGCDLFRPSSNGLINTSLGAELARRLGVAVRELDYALEEIQATKGREVGHLNIGVQPMSGTFALAAAINALTRKHPHCRIRVVEGTYLTLLKGLRAGELDMNFGLIRRPEWATDVTEVPLFDDAFCVVVRRDHPLTRIAKPSREDLSAYEWVVPATGTPRRDAIDEFFSSTTSPPTFAVETSSISVIWALVANSDRVSVLSRHEVDFEELAMLFDVLPIQIGAPSSKGITMRANWLPTSLHSELIDLLRQHTAAAQSFAAPGPDIVPFIVPVAKTGAPETAPAGGRPSTRRPIKRAAGYRGS